MGKIGQEYFERRGGSPSKTIGRGTAGSRPAGYKSGPSPMPRQAITVPDEPRLMDREPVTPRTPESPMAAWIRDQIDIGGSDVGFLIGKAIADAVIDALDDDASIGVVIGDIIDALNDAE